MTVRASLLFSSLVFLRKCGSPPTAGRPPWKVSRSYAIFSARFARFDCLLGSCELDGLGHCQDLLTAWLVVVMFLGVLSEMGDKLVVGIGAYSE